MSTAEWARESPLNSRRDTEGFPNWRIKWAMVRYRDLLIVWSLRLTNGLIVKSVIVGKKKGTAAFLEVDGRIIFYLITKERYFHKPTYDTIERSIKVWGTVDYGSLIIVGHGIDYDEERDQGMRDASNWMWTGWIELGKGTVINVFQLRHLCSGWIDARDSFQCS